MEYLIITACVICLAVIVIFFGNILLTSYLEKRKIAQNIKNKAAWRKANPELARAEDQLAKLNKKREKENNKRIMRIMNSPEVQAEKEAKREAEEAEKAKNKALAEAIAKAMADREAEEAKNKALMEELRKRL